jgi:hypothetical protein
MTVDACSTRSERRRLPRWASALAALAAAAGIALLASACGGSSPSAAVAAVGTTAGATGETSPDTPAKADPTAFAACMRSHGVADFPDPDSKGRIKITSGMSADGKRTGVDPNGPQWQKAMASCKQLEPNGGVPDARAQAAAIKQMLGFASCMRAHGVSKFPDPQVAQGGGVMQTMKVGDGLDPASPTFQAAQKTCQKLQPDGPKLQTGGGSGGGNVAVGGSSAAP